MDISFNYFTEADTQAFEVVSNSAKIARVGNWVLIIDEDINGGGYVLEITITDGDNAANEVFQKTFCTVGEALRQVKLLPDAMHKPLDLETYFGFVQVM